MSDVAIKVENLGKSYLIGHQTGTRGQDSFREVVTRQVGGFVRNVKDMVRGRQIIQGDKVEEFWALQNISFEVKCGEVLGVIGRNGAGKSTLLKVLGRITEPTLGRVGINGRVATLLEVGTGFHPELSGRENIYLNGAILGMSRHEIGRKFEEIVDFAEIEKFLDTPVKRYSSGMYVRLAFAVAAHLEPEILIVDEVLAVGDAQFQAKCLGKMRNVAHEGRTVLIVSHNMPMINSLCSRALAIHSGAITYDGSVEQAVQNYLGSGLETIYCSDLRNRADREGNGRLRFVEAYVVGRVGIPNLLQMGDDVEVVLRISAKGMIPQFDVTILIENVWEQTVVRVATRETATPLKASSGDHVITCRLPMLPLLPGRYHLFLAASIPTSFEYFDYIGHVSPFNVVEADVYGTGKVPESGIFFAHCNWTQASVS
jgi:lipopolysaccharide transport system ATP-binding protein